MWASWDRSLPWLLSAHIGYLLPDGPASVQLLGHVNRRRRRVWSALQATALEPDDVLGAYFGAPPQAA
eukprot:14563558-Alexandrium_andersonii.AAC.1